MTFSKKLLAAAAAAALVPVVMAEPLTLGFDTYISFPTYKDYSPQVYPLPQIHWENDLFYVDGLSAGVNVWRADSQVLRVGLAWMPLYFDASKSDDSRVSKLSDRDSSIAAQVEYILQGQYGRFSAKLMGDLSGNSDGFLARASYGYPFVVDTTTITPSVGLTWASDNFANYYYGVWHSESVKSGGLREYKADSYVMPTLSVSVANHITPNWTVTGLGTVNFMPNEIQDSPMTSSRSMSFGVGMGVSYTFR